MFRQGIHTLFFFLNLKETVLRFQYIVICGKGLQTPILMFLLLRVMTPYSDYNLRIYSSLVQNFFEGNNNKSQQDASKIKLPPGGGAVVV